MATELRTFSSRTGIEIDLAVLPDDIRERALACGGSAVVERIAEGGTRLLVTIPI